MWANMFFFQIFLYAQYLLYGPFIGKLLYSKFHEDAQTDTWCLHILILCALRGFIHQLWCSYSNMLFLTRNRRIQKQGVDFKQIDREWDWYLFFWIQSTFFLVSYMGFPVPWLWYLFHFSNFPFFTGTTSYFFKLSLLQWPSTSFHSLLIYLYGIQEALLLLWYSTLGFQSLSTIGYTDASMETISLPVTIHCTMRLQSHSPLQVKGIKTICPFNFFFFSPHNSFKDGKISCLFIQSFFYFVYCSRECNVFGASDIKCGCWNSSTGFFAHGIWIHQHDIRICPHLWFSQMLGALQCWSCSSCHVPCLSLPQVPHLHTYVSSLSSSLIFDFDDFTLVEAFLSLDILSTTKRNLIIYPTHNIYRRFLEANGTHTSRSHACSTLRHWCMHPHP